MKMKKIAAAILAAALSVTCFTGTIVNAQEQGLEAPQVTSEQATPRWNLLHGFSGYFNPSGTIAVIGASAEGYSDVKNIAFRFTVQYQSGGTFYDYDSIYIGPYNGTSLMKEAVLSHPTGKTTRGKIDVILNNGAEVVTQYR